MSDAESEKSSVIEHRFGTDYDSAYDTGHSSGGDSGEEGAGTAWFPGARESCDSVFATPQLTVLRQRCWRILVFVPVLVLLAALVLASESVVLLYFSFLVVALILHHLCRGGLPSPVGFTTVAPSPELTVEEQRHRPHLQGTFMPSTGVVRSNGPAPIAFENENCVGSFLPLHRPTYDKALDASNQYPYGEHFAGRKRLWEMRLQFQFKETPSESVCFGIELEEYVPLNGAAKSMMAVTVAALKRIAGKDLYHSPGDDPQLVKGPAEKPVFMMPLWAFDQVIVTPAGEDTPDLTSPSFHKLGLHRASNRKAFIKEMCAMKLMAGPTYTFSFWGISQFLDGINWQVRKVVPFTTVGFNQFCGKPPVNLVLYSLRDSDDPRETRHLQYRKNYYFRLAFWSSEDKPSKAKLAELLPGRLASREAPTAGGFSGRVIKQTTTRDSRSFLARRFGYLIDLLATRLPLTSIACVSGRDKIFGACHERPSNCARTRWA
jgi:hypothetical protein